MCMVFITGNVHICKNVMDEIVLILLEFHSMSSNLFVQDLAQGCTL